MNLGEIQLDKQKKILIVLFSVLIIYVDANYILKAQLAGLKNIGPKISGFERDIKNLNRDLEGMRLPRGKDAATPVSLQSTKIIAEGQVSGLMQDIANLGNKFDIKINQIKPSREMGKTPAPGEKFSPIFINLDIVCDYHNLGKFINSLETWPVFMSVSDFKISVQLPDYIKQKATLVIKTYVSK